MEVSPEQPGFLVAAYGLRSFGSDHRLIATGFRVKGESKIDPKEDEGPD